MSLSGLSDLVHRLQVVLWMQSPTVLMLLGAVLGVLVCVVALELVSAFRLGGAGVSPAVTALRPADRFSRGAP